MFDNTMRIYGPNLYSRGLTVDDAEHVQRILSDWEDWPLSDQKAEALTKIWATRTADWVAPFQDGVVQESIVLFCLRSNDLPVVLDRNRQDGTVGNALFAATAPENRLNGYYDEATKLLAIGAWNHYGMTQSIAQEWKDNKSLLSHSIRDSLEGPTIEGTSKQTAPDYKETSISLEQWNGFKNSALYDNWVIPYTLYPKWPGDPL